MSSSLGENESSLASVSHERRAHDELFRLLVETLRDYAIFILEPSGRVATWNAGAERIKGYRASEIIGKHFSVFYPPDVIASGKCEEELDVAAKNERFQEEGWRLRKDGSPFWAHVTITALRDGAGTLLGFAIVTRDLTERGIAEEETRRFRLLVESVKDYAIFILDPTGHVVTWNSGAERIKGYKSREILGRHFSVFYPRDVAATGKCELELATATTEGRFEEEGIRIRKDGTEFWANVTITSLRGPQGDIVGFAKVTRDLTERRRAEEDRRRLAAEAAALREKARIQQFQERFLGILGHDLRNPLASMDMGAALIRQRTNDPVMLRVLDRVDSSSRRMSRMIEQILDLTRSRLGGGLPVDPRPMDLGEAIVGIVDELRTAHPSRTVELSCSTTPGQWDGDRLEQVFSNLIGNALMHGDSAKPVTIALRSDLDSVTVEVHNDGPPLSTELHATLFDPFRRGERESRTSKTTGLGLGLYISNEIVVAHGGRIEVRSNSVDGTMFRVVLPRHVDHGAVAMNEVTK